MGYTAGISIALYKHSTWTAVLAYIIEPFRHEYREQQPCILLLTHIRLHRSRSTLAQVMVCRLPALSHCLNECSLVTKSVLWHSLENNFNRSSTSSSWWRHQKETFSALTFCAGNSPITGEVSAQRPVTRRFDVFCTWINGWVNNREAGDLRRHRAHYDVILMLTCVQR